MFRNDENDAAKKTDMTQPIPEMTDIKTAKALDMKNRIDEQKVENIVEDLIYDMTKNFNNGMLNVDNIRKCFNDYLNYTFYNGEEK